MARGGNQWPPKRPTDVALYGLVKAIDDGIRWYETEEGHAYWLDVAINLAAISGYSKSELKEFRESYE